jgi:hypothetical protein
MRWAIIPTGVVIQVLLMICLCIPPLSCRQDLCRNLAGALVPALLSQLRHFTRSALLLAVVVEDGAPILRADVWPLTVGRCGIMHAVEELDELAVGYLRRIVSYLEGFGV